jgi:putative ABC transport system permease protein
MLSYALWQRQFGGDPGLVGRPAYVNGFPYTVIGIMPADFRPVGTLALGDEVELWRPLAPDDNQTGGRGARQLRVVGRLREDVTVAQAQAELDQIAQGLAQEYPETNAGTGVRVVSMRDQVVHDVRSALLLLLGAVALVLLIACTNVGNLLLARATARKKQIALRVALGAPRSRIVQQLLIESLLLGAVGGILGLGIATVGAKALVALGPADIPLLEDVGVDYGVLAFTAGISLLAGVLFGLVPALQSSKPNVIEDLKVAGRTSSGTSAHSVADLLVVSEVALAFVLLMAAGLLMRSFRELMRVDPGFDPTNVVTLQIELPMGTTYRRQEQRDRFFQELLDRIEANPDIETASMSNAPPLGEGGFDVNFIISGMGYRPLPEQPLADLRVVDPSYFETMGISLVTGRAFTAQDDRRAPRVAIINQSMAKSLWPDDSPIGSQIELSYGPRAEIVGVVVDVYTNGLDAEVRPTIYWPSDQLTYNFMTVLARTNSQRTGAVVRAIRRELGEMDSDLPIYNVATMEQLISDSVAERRFQMVVIGSFSTLAVLLAVVGIYGVIAYSVGQRTREMGIRMALGARSLDTLSLVLKQGLWLAVIGITLGAAVSLAFNRLLEGFLYGVGTTDPATYLFTAGLLGAVALLATFVPASRAARVNPLIALREE